MNTSVEVTLVFVDGMRRTVKDSLWYQKTHSVFSDFPTLAYASAMGVQCKSQAELDNLFRGAQHVRGLFIGDLNKPAEEN